METLKSKLVARTEIKLDDFSPLRNPDGLEALAEIERLESELAKAKAQIPAEKRETPKIHDADGKLIYSKDGWADSYTDADGKRWRLAQRRDGSMGRLPIDE